MPDGPFCFFGYSMGGLVALATVQELQRRGRPLPSRLIVAAAPSPIGEREPVAEMSDEAIIDEIRLSGTVPEFILREREVMKAMLPTIRADLELLETFRNENEASPLQIPIVAYGSLSDPLVEPAEIASWSSATSSNFRMRFFPGNHYFLKSAAEPLFEDLTAELRKLAA
jgi:medium-chain acyl-[acyl-carrier-protein] hydrolase